MTSAAQARASNKRRRTTPLVLVVGPLPPPMMGHAVATGIVCRALERMGVNVVHVNTTDDRRGSGETVFNTNVLDLRNVALAARHSAQMVWETVRHRPQLVYIPISQGRWGYARDAVLMTIARVLRRPIVVHLHGSNLQRFFGQSTLVERYMISGTLGWATYAIALTPQLRGVYDGLVPAERVRVLENAIPDPWPTGLAQTILARRERASRAPERLRILFVANDFTLKGAQTLVRALADPDLRHARARLVGMPPPRAVRATRDLASRLGVADRVELLGGLDGPAKWAQFEWADAFGYPTNDDGQPLVILEAMAAALPIVASPVGGVEGTIGGTAVLVAPDDDRALATALRSLIDEPERRFEFGGAARARFLDRYTPDAFQVRFAGLFTEMLRLQGDACTA